ncbi:reverse transcriptase, partial [Trifolium medium]|nr:reverse transcriptase [Trifolium medium]
VNVYSKCELEGKRRLWETLRMSKGGFGRGAWCVIGDFNAVLHREERWGVNDITFHSSSVEMVEFEAFVNHMELEDIPSLGRKFTWFHSNGISMSRIDRAMVSDEWINFWGYPSLWILPRSVSDHCALLLRHNVVDWGPKPFRFKNHWLQNNEFKVLVEDSWRSQQLTGWMGFILKEKLKGLKGVIREWNKEAYGVLDSKIMLLVEEIKQKDLRGEAFVLTEEEVELR